MSLFVQLKNRIWKDHLDSGKSAAGKKLPTVTELASEYQVSATTVSKAVAMLVAEGWLVNRKGSGMYVADMAQKQVVRVPVAKGHRKIGYIAGDIGVTLAYEALRGVEYIARKNDYVLELANTSNDMDEEYRQIAAMRDRGVSGIVLYPAFMRDESREFLANEFRDLPIVVIDMYQPEMRRPHIIFDNEAAGGDITRYLLEQGHRHIGFLRCDLHPYRSVDDRIEGFKRALADADIAFSEAYHILEIGQEVFSPELGPYRFEPFLKRWFAMSPQPTALISFYEYIVPDLIQCFTRMGLSVPNDITIASFDNQIYDSQYKWATTCHDFMRMGEKSAELLIEYIDKKNDMTTETRVIMPCPLLVPSESHRMKYLGNIKAVRSIRPMNAKVLT